jgi:hypothetical protein
VSERAEILTVYPDIGIITIYDVKCWYACLSNYLQYSLM